MCGQGRQGASGNVLEQEWNWQCSVNSAVSAPTLRTRHMHLSCLPRRVTLRSVIPPYAWEARAHRVSLPRQAVSASYRAQQASPVTLW